MIYNEQLKVYDPTWCEQTIDSAYTSIKFMIINLLNLLENNEYNWKRGHPCIKVPYILGSPVIYTLTHQNEEILYKDGMICNDEMCCKSRDWKVLQSEGMLKVYKILYGLLINGVI